MFHILKMCQWSIIGHGILYNLILQVYCENYATTNSGTFQTLNKTQAFSKISSIHTNTDL